MSSPWRHIPNVISVARILLVAPVAVALLRHELTAALALFALAAVSDALDGWLAKRFAWQSELGGILDPIADKLLLITVLITLCVLQRVPVWLTATAAARDLIIVIGAVAYRSLIGPLTAHPSRVSKLNTLCQAGFILSVVGQAFSRPDPFADPLAVTVQWLGALTFATTVVSGIDYVKVYGQRAAAAGRMVVSP